MNMNIDEEHAELRARAELARAAMWGKFVCPEHYIVGDDVVRAFPIYQIEEDFETSVLDPYDYHYEVVGPKSHAEKIARRLGFR